MPDDPGRETLKASFENGSYDFEVKTMSGRDVERRIQPGT
jgi:hypothetical protein